MRNDKAILESARNGYHGRKDEGMWSSPCWVAAQAGKALYAKGQPEIIKAHSSRGYSVKLETSGGAQWLVRCSGDLLADVVVERLTQAGGRS